MGRFICRSGTAPSCDVIPDEVVFAHVPRVRCLDCLGKLYSLGSEHTAENFDVHPRNRLHRAFVGMKVNAEGWVTSNDDST